MSQHPRNLVGKVYEIPENPVYLEFSETDGSPARWPGNTVEIVDNEGHVNYMRPVIGTEESLNRKWYVEVGRRVAEMLGKPGKKFAYPSFIKVLTNS